MKIRAPRDRRQLAIALAFGVATALAGCGSKEERTPQPRRRPRHPAAAAGTACRQHPPRPHADQRADVANATWTPEALEELLAPIALYPDPVLSQVLIASTNPQEVLDAGNWLIANEGLKGKALDDAAAQVGFTPPIRALVQFPETVDMMCMELGWTTELGQAFVADQAGVLDAVQRLRKQAMDVGNLQVVGAMKVETQEQEGKEVVVLKPAEARSRLRAAVRSAGGLRAGARRGSGAGHDDDHDHDRKDGPQHRHAGHHRPARVRRRHPRQRTLR